MDSAQKQLADKISTSNNVLISVSRDPSVDQLAAMLGLALAVNKTGRHAAAVFSGAIPWTLEFLQPEATFEKNTDSLRDFIIALDKAKADKLRYKVEDDLVRIFITPYKTSLSDADLSFSQGDFNVDLVIALGVTRQEDLDEAITAHGRILHDATVTSITVSDGQGDQLGSINWHEPDASSLSELTTELVQIIDQNLIDGQIATALLTGIVSETERFSNDKTSAQTMSISALLMAAGANQQLVASKLEEPAPALEPDESPSDDTDDDQDEGGEPAEEPEDPKPTDGAFEINHDDEPKHDDVAAPVADILPEPQPEAEPETPEEPKEEAAPEEQQEEPQPEEQSESNGRAVIEDSIRGGQLTASSSPEALDPVTDPLGVQDTSDQPLLSRDAAPVTNPFPDLVQQFDAGEPAPAPVPDLIPEPAPQPAAEAEPESAAPSLSDIEASFTPTDEPQAPQVEVGDARDEVSKALSSEAANQPPEAIQALNAQPLGESLHPLEMPQAPLAAAPLDTNNDGYTSVEELVGQPEQTPVFDPLAPPPVPPPLFNPAQFGQPPAGPVEPPKQ